MTPNFHHEIARQRHAELIRTAKRERLAAEIVGSRESVVLSVARRLRRLALGRAVAPEPRVLHPTS